MKTTKSVFYLFYEGLNQYNIKAYGILLFKLLLLMLLQTEFLIADLHKNGQRFEWNTNDSARSWDTRWLDWTIQCNWKLKRHRTFFNVESMQVDNDWLFPPEFQTMIKNRSPLHEAVAIFKNLWYDFNEEALYRKIQDSIQSEEE